MASRTTRINANNNNIMTMIIIIINFENRLRCVVEERGLRAVFKDKQSSYQQLLVKAKLPSLYNRRLQDICILMYKVKHNLCPRTICDMFLTNSHTYNLRQKDFYQPSFNTVTHGKQSVRYLGPRLWSKIPSKDRSAASLKQFKTRIRSLDLSNILDG